jgi:hypothetical protein
MTEDHVACSVALRDWSESELARSYRACAQAQAVLRHVMLQREARESMRSNAGTARDS